MAADHVELLRRVVVHCGVQRRASGGQPLWVDVFAAIDGTPPVDTTAQCDNMRDMSTADTAPAAKPLKWVWFTTAKNGRKMAFEFSRRQFRAFRVPLADAELWVATGVAEKLDGHPFPGNGLR